jgi:hypothetical protein
MIRNKLYGLYTPENRTILFACRVEHSTEFNIRFDL